ncbi:MAG TPA: MerR family transcriptional regulator [Baekduia sp.]|nr:MerR family transcriptional regulator [Baekduia sp.]
MATDALIARLLDAAAEAAGASVVDALHALLDDSTIEADAPPKTIAEAAELTGLSAYTLRYYEDAGLVRPQRNGSGHRAYDAAALRRLVFVTRMRASGMTMRELKRYIMLVEQGPGTEPERRAMMLSQRERIQRQLRELTLALEATEYKIRTYGGHPGDPAGGPPLAS